MANSLYDAIDKADTIVSLIRDYYTNGIASQSQDSQNSDNVEFTVGTHHFVENDMVLIAGIVDSNGEDISEYNSSFKVLSVTNTTVTVELEYNSEAVFTNATMNSVRVYNNVFVNLGRYDFCSVIVDIDDTLLIPSASHSHIPGKTFYPLIVINTIHNFTKGNNTQVRATRRYVSVKMDEILELLEDSLSCCKVVNSVNRSEDVWSNSEVSLIATTLEY